MANVFHVSKPVTDNITYVNADAGVVIDIGDLLYYDGTYAQPASAQADGGTEAANQASAAPLYLGVANSARTGDETTDGEVAVITDRLFHFPCSSAAFEVGDSLAFVESGGGVALEDQKVVKTTDETLAIARVVKREASAVTKVWARFTSRVLPNNSAPDTSASLSSASLPVIVFNGATGINEIRVPTNLADALSIESSAGDIVVIDTTTGAVAVTITTSAASGLTLAGHVTMGDAKNVILNATTGTKIGTATSQKLGFWNATPVVQYSTTGTVTGFTAGSGTASKDDSTYTGNSGTKAYTVGDIVLALKTAGIMAAS